MLTNWVWTDLCVCNGSAESTKKVSVTEIARLGVLEPGSKAVLQLSEVYTVENQGLPEQSIYYDELAKQYKHLFEKGQMINVRAESLNKRQSE